MNEFIKSLLSEQGTISSKRFISLVCLLLLVLVVVSSLFKIIVPDNIIYSILSGLLGSSAMTLKRNNQSNTGVETANNINSDFTENTENSTNV